MDRYGFDDLRRFAAALGTACGLSPPRALTMASHLLWFNAAGATNLGISSLPAWLNAIAEGHVDPKAEGRMVRQRSALSILDGENGLPPLILERAAEVAVQTARDTAVGMVRVDHIGRVESTAAVVAGIALGPMAGMVIGPNRLWSAALPSEKGLPIVVDKGLALAKAVAKPGRVRTSAKSVKSLESSPKGSSSALDYLDGLRLAADVLIPSGSWLVVAVSVAAVEPLATFQERVAAWTGLAEFPGHLLPQDWDQHRREARADGIAIVPSAWKSLHAWARRLGIEVPAPLAPKQEPA